MCMHTYMIILWLNYLKLSYFLGVTIFIKSDSFLQDGFPLSVKQTSFEILYLILGRFECWNMFVQMQMVIPLRNRRCAGLPGHNNILREVFKKKNVYKAVRLTAWGGRGGHPRPA